MEKRQVRVMTQKGDNYIMDNKTVEREPKYEFGVFHGWDQVKDVDFSKTYALIELENGKVGRYDIDEFTFTNRPAGSNMFEEGFNDDEIGSTTYND